MTTKNKKHGKLQSLGGGIGTLKPTKEELNENRKVLKNAKKLTENKKIVKLPAGFSYDFEKFKEEQRKKKTV